MLFSRSLLFTLCLSIGIYFLSDVSSGATELNQEIVLSKLLEQANKIKAEIDKLNTLTVSSINRFETLNKKAQKCTENSIKKQIYDTDCYKENRAFIEEHGIENALNYAVEFNKRLDSTSFTKINVKSMVTDSKREVDNFVQSLKTGDFSDDRSSKIEYCNLYNAKDEKLITYSLNEKLELVESEVVTSANDLLNTFINNGCIFYHEFYDVEEKPSIYIPFKATDKTPYEAIYSPPLSNDKFIEKCINNMTNVGAVDRLHEIARDFDDHGRLETLSKIQDNNIKNCNKSAQFLCENAYEVKGTLILSYETVGCVIRDVTVEDVEEDMKWMATNAEKVKHSTMIDTIEVCRKARDVGYYWLYKKPILSKKCSASLKKKNKK